MYAQYSTSAKEGGHFQSLLVYSVKEHQLESILFSRYNFVEDPIFLEITALELWPPRELTNVFQVSSNQDNYGLRTSLAKEVKGQMSIVTVYQTFRPI